MFGFLVTFVISFVVLVAMQTAGMSWEEALKYAQTAEGVAIVVGFLVFLASEYIPGFVQQIENEKIKRLVVAGLSMIIPVGALLLEVFTVSGAPITFNDVWTAIFTGLTSFGAATLVHTAVLGNNKA